MENKKNDKKALVNRKCLLQKFPGKGGWTYTEIPEIAQDKNNPFGWVKVKGMIDGYEIKQYKLMPMGEGKLFLPVKATIRKKIKKEAGDYVKVTLYSDESEIIVPDEILKCFEFEEKETLESFNSLSEGEKKTYIDWIYEAKKEDTKIKRIAEMIKRLSNGNM